MQKIYFLGLSDALKPLFILQILKRHNFFNEYEVEFIGNKQCGCVIDFCVDNKINCHVIDNFIVNKKKKEGTLVVIGWSYLLKDNVLSLFDTAINCHGGLLPDYRGNNTYMHAFANMADTYGATIHYIDSTFDNGDIVMRGELKLYKEETPEIMHRRICEITALMIPNALVRITDRSLSYKQKGEARYFYKISREEMWKIRKENEERLQQGLSFITCKNKTWNLE